MKKTISFLLILINALMFTACSSKNTNTSQGDGSEVHANIDMSVYQITKTNYDNLDLSKVKVYFPDITEYHNLRLYSKNDADIDERISIVKEIVEKYFPEHTYSDDYLTWWGQIPGIFEIREDGMIREEYPDGWTKYPNVAVNKQTIADLGFKGAFLYESDAAGENEHDAYLVVDPCAFSGTLIKDTLRKTVNSESVHLASYFPTCFYETIEQYEIDSVTDDSYKLYDTEVSLPEAVDFAADFFANDYINSWIDTPVKTEISVVELCKYENIYGYRFLLKNTYEGMAFDYDNIGMGSQMSDGKSYADFTNEAFMAESNSIDFWYMQQPYTRVEYDGEAITNIISLEEALSIMSDKLTKSVVFEVNTVDFVYCPLDFEEGSSETTAEAAWKITAINPNDGKTYVVYVNAINGEIRYLKN